jgi:hypothetical protein
MVGCPDGDQRQPLRDMNERSCVCEANSGLIDWAGGVVIATQSDLAQGGKVTINRVPGEEAQLSGRE